MKGTTADLLEKLCSIIITAEKNLLCALAEQENKYTLPFSTTWP